MTAAVAPVTADPGRATGAARGAAVGLAVVQRRAAEAVLAVLDGRNADAAIASVEVAANAPSLTVYVALGTTPW